MWSSVVVLPLSVFVGAALGMVRTSWDDDDMVLTEMTTLTNDLARVKSLHMGYLQTHSSRKEPMYPMSEDEMRKEIQNAYRKLQCSYALFALRQLGLTDELWLKPNTMSERAEINQVMFQAEAAAMLAAALDEPRLTPIKYILWPFWLYTDRVQRFVEAIAEKRMSAKEIHYIIHWRAHRSLEWLLELFLKSDQCAPYDVDKKLTYIQEQKKLALPIRMIFTSNNKEMFFDQKVINNPLGVSTDNERKISMRALCLNGLEKLHGLIVQYLGVDSWDMVEHNFVAMLNDVMNLDVTLSKQAKSMIAFQNEFVVILKLTVLQLCRQYLAANTEHVNPDVMKKHDRKVVTALLSFGKAIGRPRDDIVFTVNELIIHGKTYGNESTDMVTDMATDMDTDMATDQTTNSVLVEVDNAIEQIVNSSNIPAIAERKVSINVDQQGDAEVPDGFHESSVKRIESFVDDVKIMFSNVDFNIVNSFNLYMSSEEHRRMNNYETSMESYTNAASTTL